MELLRNVTSGLYETLVYVAIALVTLVGVLKCVYPVFRNGTLLNRAVMKLEKSAASDVAVWREPRFLGRSLRAEWQRFLLNAGQLDLRGIPCNTEEYINEDAVVYKPGHSQLAELIPSLLTSLGILGTFLGLMDGLTSVNFTDAAGTIESIPALLTGMRFAFATSVAGISCSIGFNILNRMTVGRAFKALDSFDEAFYELAMPRPLEPDVQLICQRQDDDASLRRTAEGLSNQISSTMEIAVARAMQPLAMSIDNLLKGVTREQIDGVQRIVGQFVQQMNASLNGQFLAMGETMKMVNQGQEVTRDSLDKAAQVAQALTQQLDRAQELARRQTETGAALNPEIMNSLQASLEQQRVGAEALNRACAEWTSALRAQPTEHTEPSGRAALNAELEAVTISLAQLKVALDDLNGRVNQLRAEPAQLRGGQPTGPLGYNDEEPPRSPATPRNKRKLFSKGV